jgi:hypothetical protein
MNFIGFIQPLSVYDLFNAAISNALVLSGSQDKNIIKMYVILIIRCICPIKVHQYLYAPINTSQHRYTANHTGHWGWQYSCVDLQILMVFLFTCFPILYHVYITQYVALLMFILWQLIRHATLSLTLVKQLFANNSSTIFAYLSLVIVCQPWKTCPSSLRKLAWIILLKAVNKAGTTSGDR